MADTFLVLPQDASAFYSGEEQTRFLQDLRSICKLASIAYGDDWRHILTLRLDCLDGVKGRGIADLRENYMPPSFNLLGAGYAGEVRLNIQQGYIADVQNGSQRVNYHILSRVQMRELVARVYAYCGRIYQDNAIYLQSRGYYDIGSFFGAVEKAPELLDQFHMNCEVARGSLDHFFERFSSAEHVNRTQNIDHFKVLHSDISHRDLFYHVTGYRKEIEKRHQQAQSGYSEVVNAALGAVVTAVFGYVFAAHGVKFFAKIMNNHELDNIAQTLLEAPLRIEDQFITQFRFVCSAFKSRVRDVFLKKT